MNPKGEPSVRGAKAKNQRKQTAAEQHLTILMIEDDAALAEMYKMKLENAGLSVVISSDGKYGLKAIKDIHPDLVLLDILMPGKDGFDVLAEKNKCPIAEVRNVPVVVLTNLASQADQNEGKRLGARDWWIKAYNTPAEVAEKVKSFLSLKNS